MIKTYILVFILETFCDKCLCENFKLELSCRVNLIKTMHYPIRLLLTSVFVAMLCKSTSSCCNFYRLKVLFSYSVNIFMRHVIDFNYKIMVGDLVFTLHIRYNHKRISTSKNANFRSSEPW